jgi:superoxide dismutase, Fe-Mn family
MRNAFRPFRKFASALQIRHRSDTDSIQGEQSNRHSRSKFFTQSYLWTGIAFLVLLVSCQVSTPIAQSSPSNPTASPAVNVAQNQGVLSVASPGTQLSANPAQLAPLPYAYEALEPTIDAQTMRLHHDKHHKTYVDKLNQALQQAPNLQGKSVEALLQDLNNVPENIRDVIQNNGGGHLNHTIFWQIMAPNATGKPTGALAEAITKTFGSFDSFKQQFNTAGGDRFGSGWVWLVRNPQGQLQITTTQNQDNPIKDGLYPILGNDVWEHAYYLKYQNRRPEYLTNWWNVVNWAEVDRRFTQANTAKP